MTKSTDSCAKEHNLKEGGGEVRPQNSIPGETAYEFPRILLYGCNKVSEEGYSEEIPRTPLSNLRTIPKLFGSNTEVMSSTKLSAGRTAIPGNQEVISVKSGRT